MPVARPAGCAAASAARRSEPGGKISTPYHCNEPQPHGRRSAAARGGPRATRAGAERSAQEAAPACAEGAAVEAAQPGDRAQTAGVAARHTATGTIAPRRGAARPPAAQAPGRAPGHPAARRPRTTRGEAAPGAPGNAAARRGERYSRGGSWVGPLLFERGCLLGSKREKLEDRQQKITIPCEFGYPDASAAKQHAQVSASGL